MPCVRVHRYISLSRCYSELSNKAVGEAAKVQGVPLPGSVPLRTHLFSFLTACQVMRTKEPTSQPSSFPSFFPCLSGKGIFFLKIETRQVENILQFSLTQLYLPLGLFAGLLPTRCLKLLSRQALCSHQISWTPDPSVRFSQPLPPRS